MWTFVNGKNKLIFHKSYRCPFVYIAERWGLAWPPLPDESKIIRHTTLYSIYLLSNCIIWSSKSLHFDPAFLINVIIPSLNERDSFMFALEYRRKLSSAGRKFVLSFEGICWSTEKHTLLFPRLFSMFVEKRKIVQYNFELTT